MPPDPRALAAQLREVEARLRRTPSPALRYERALLLDRLGKTDQARGAYESLLTAKPDHFAALNNLAMLEWKAGRRAEAFRRYLEAVERHPDNAVAHANLGYVYVRADQLQQAREHYETAVRLDPDNADARRGLAAVLTQLGGGAAAAAGAAGDAVSTVEIPYRGDGTPVRVLQLVTLGAGNVPADRLLDPRRVAATRLVVELHGDGPLPPHDVVFNGIGDADASGDALRLAEAIVARTNAPVINRPERVSATGRVANAARLGSLPGVLTAKIERLPRAALTGPAAVRALEDRGFEFPLLLRSPGTHTGRNFERVDEPGALAATAAALPGDALLVLEYLDTRDDAGAFRKYRMIAVDGALYPLHLAISERWKVHFFSGDTAAVEAHRADDEAFLADPAGTLGEPAMAALRRVVATLGLDYAGIDFARNPDGGIVVFEANATMIVAEPAAEARWDYRRVAADRVVAAVDAMLRARTSRATA